MCLECLLTSALLTALSNSPSKQHQKPLSPLVLSILSVPPVGPAWPLFLAATSKRYCQNPIHQQKKLPVGLDFSHISSTREFTCLVHFFPCCLQSLLLLLIQFCDELGYFGLVFFNNYFLLHQIIVLDVKIVNANTTNHKNQHHTTSNKCYQSSKCTISLSTDTKQASCAYCYVYITKAAKIQ